MKFFLQLGAGIVAILFLGAGSSLPTASAEMLSDKEKQTLSNHLPRSRGEYHHPTHSDQNYAFLRADVLEYRPGEDGGDFRWDIQGWYGGDFNRLWFKSEGERNTAFKADHDIDMQLLYGRFIGKYYDFRSVCAERHKSLKGEMWRGLMQLSGFKGSLRIATRWSLRSLLARMEMCPCVSRHPATFC